MPVFKTIRGCGRLWPCAGVLRLGWGCVRRSRDLYRHRITPAHAGQEAAQVVGAGRLDGRGEVDSVARERLREAGPVPHQRQAIPVAGELLGLLGHLVEQRAGDPLGVFGGEEVDGSPVLLLQDSGALSPSRPGVP
jgi:hypothetical protein